MSITFQNMTRKAFKQLYVIMPLLVCILSLFLILVSRLSQQNERMSGEISSDVYVWQRQWNADVSEAVTEASSEMSGFAVLAAEVSFSKGQIKDIIPVPIDYEALKSIQKPVAIALRIGPFSGDFRDDHGITEILSGIARSLIEDARKNGIEPVELQVDFDCAESRLDSYRELVKEIKAYVSRMQVNNSSGQNLPVPVVITALPCWMKHRQFKTLVQEADGFVLQVHSLERPESPDSLKALCDTASSLKWVEKAAGFGVPFRVALPTYGYIVGFDRDGRFLGISAEGPSQNWPEGTILRTVCSDASAIAQLVQKWQKDRPVNMKGIIWYRLPVETDRLNWKWKTLEMVMSGQKPKEEIAIKVDYPQTGLAQITLANIGLVDYTPDIKVEIECQRSDILASDGMNGFVFDSGNPWDVSFKMRDENNLLKIRPGEELMVGWLRFDKDIKVKAYASEIH